MKKSRKKLFAYDNVGILFVLPAFVYMLIFVGYPIVRNIILSFQDVTVRTLTKPDKPFAGLQNYIEIFQDPVFIRSLINTLVFTVCCLVFQFIIGFLLALFFNQNFRTSKVVRGLLLIPWMIPITVTALIFKFIFGTDVGILNYALQSLGIIKENIDWLTSTNTAMFALICANVWIGIPFNMILISTGLTTIPTELYESAALDGAGKIQTFFYTFKVYDLVYVMTSGGPVNSTHMLSTYSYKLSFELFRYSDGAAVANVLLVILLIVGVFYLRATKEENE